MGGNGWKQNLRHIAQIKIANKRNNTSTITYIGDTAGRGLGGESISPEAGLIAGRRL